MPIMVSCCLAFYVLVLISLVAFARSSNDNNNNDSSSSRKIIRHTPRAHQLDDSNRDTTTTHDGDGRILSIDDFGAIPDHTDAYLTQHQRWVQQRNLDPLYRPGYDDGVVVDSEDENSVEHDGLSGSSQQQLQQERVEEVAEGNTLAFNLALQHAQPGDTVLVPDGHSYTFTGGVSGKYLDRVTIDVAGTAHFLYNRRIWPFVNTTKTFGYEPAISFQDSTNIILTSSSRNRAGVVVDYRKNMVYLDHDAGTGGLINGNGKEWWNDALAGRLPAKNGDTRPRLVHIISCANVVVEKITLINSPFWTLTVEAVGAEIAHVNVLVDRKYQTDLFAEVPSNSSSIFDSETGEDDDVEIKTDMASQRRQLLLPKSLDFVFPVDDLPDWVFRRLRQPQDLNTDGIDPIGMHMHIHDCVVQNADDSVAVKPSSAGQHAAVVNHTIPYPCTRNITIENMVLTGFGASIGSVGPSKFHPCVDQVTFRNITMPGTGKGIYIKSDGNDCHANVSSRITNILYENIYIRNPFWWAIWIGPQQQHQPNTRLGRKCPLTYPLPGNKHCPTQGCVLFENITLRNVWIDDPIISPGVIMGNASNPMRNVVFDNVTATTSHWKPFHGRWPFHGRKYPWKPGFQCESVQGTCIHCQPSPSCFLNVDAE